MASIQNDIDKLLAASTVRLVAVDGNYISLSSNYTSFNLVNGVPSPTAITITARLFGALAGNCTFTVLSGATGISYTGNIAQLAYSSLTSDSATIRASLDYLGTTYTSDITIGGQTARPGPVANFAASASGSLVKLSWTANTDADISGYEVREIDLDWGSTTGYLFKGSVTNTLVAPKARGTPATWYIRAFDTSGLYSTSTTSLGYTVDAPPDTTDITASFADTSLTNATVTLDWLPVIPPFGLSKYEVTGTISTNATTTLNSNIVTVSSTNGISPGDEIAGNSFLPPSMGMRKKVLSINHDTNTLIVDSNATGTGTLPTSFLVVKTINATTINLPANWLGEKQFTIKTIDTLGNYSNGYSEYVLKSLPNPVTNLTGKVVDNTVTLSWTLPDRTTLPIVHVLIKKSDLIGSWDTAEIVGTKSGEFTTIQELTKGTNIYWIATVDTDNNMSTPVSITLNVQSPPDYVFNAAFSSKSTGFTGTKSNCVFLDGELVMPVDTSETWEQHYVNNGWNTPNSQILSGNPIYAQPGQLTATYTEVFSTIQVLASSAIRVTISGRDVAGTTGISVQIATSLDGVTYSTPVVGNSTFATNFKFIKVIVTATQNARSIYSITDISAVLDVKLKTDSGTTDTISASDTNGSVVNFNLDFVDISAVAITPYSSTGALRIPVYNFKDVLQLGTYSISSNVITVTTSSAHELVSGQLVRLTSGAFGVAKAIITSVPNSTSFTANITAPNGSGSITVYPNSMTVYLYNDSGVRQNGTISWTIRGS